MKLMTFESFSIGCRKAAISDIKSYVGFDIAAVVLFSGVNLITLEHHAWLQTNCTMRYDGAYSNRIIFFELDDDALQFFLTWQ